MRSRLAIGVACFAIVALGADASVATAQTEPADAIPFGYNDDWRTHGDHLGIAQLGGANTTRAVISWREVEPAPGEYHWEAYDDLYRRFAQAGTRPLWVLADAPCWAWTKSPKRCRKHGLEPRPPKQGHFDDWAFFAALVAYRYPDAVAIESWNEANLGNFFKPRPDPALAAILTAWVNAGVDFANVYSGASIPTLFGGSAPLYETIPEKKEIAYDEFLRKAYEAIPGGYWDGVAIHPFPRFKAREDFMEDISEHLDALRGALADSRASGTPIWVTEIGLSTAGPFPYSYEDQAEGLTTIYRELDEMPDIAGIFIHRLIDGPRQLRTAESGWGVVQRNLTLKPALCMLAAERGRPCAVTP